MKVKLLTRKGENAAGAIVDYDRPTAEWLVEHNYALMLPGQAPEPEPEPEQHEDEAKDETPAPRRGPGRPRKA